MIAAPTGAGIATPRHRLALGFARVGVRLGLRPLRRTYHRLKPPHLLMIRGPRWAPNRRAVDAAVLTYQYRRLNHAGRRQWRRRVGPAAAASALILMGSIAAPKGYGNDGQPAYDLATRTWFGTFVGLIIGGGGLAFDVTNPVYQGGAKGNGITIDTNAVLAAVAAMPATGGQLIFPPTDAGSNYVLGPIALNKPCIVWFLDVTITAAGAGTLFPITASDVQWYGAARFNGANVGTQISSSAANDNLWFDGDFRVDSFVTGGWILFRGTNLRWRGVRTTNQEQIISNNGGTQITVSELYGTYTKANVATIILQLGSNVAFTEPNHFLVENVFLDGTGVATSVTPIVLGPNPGQSADSGVCRHCRVSKFPIDSIDMLRCRNSTLHDFKSIQCGVISLISVGLTVTDCIAWHNQGSGFVFGDPAANGAGQDMIVTGCAAIGNGTALGATGQRDRCGFTVCGNATNGVDRVLISGCTARDDGGGFQQYGYSIYDYATNCSVVDCEGRGNTVAGCVSNGGTHVQLSTTIFRHVTGFNPLGAVATPGFPATTVAVQNLTTVDVVAYGVNGANALTIQVDAVAALMVVPALAAFTVRIPAASTFTPTYAGGAPAWKWYGE